MGLSPTQSRSFFLEMFVLHVVQLLAFTLLISSMMHMCIYEATHKAKTNNSTTPKTTLFSKKKATLDGIWTHDSLHSRHEYMHTISICIIMCKLSLWGIHVHNWDRIKFWRFVGVKLYILGKQLCTYYWCVQGPMLVTIYVQTTRGHITRLMSVTVGSSVGVCMVDSSATRVYVFAGS